MASMTLKSRHVWLIIAAGSVVLATFSSITVYLNSRVAGRANWNDVVLTASVWLAFGALTRIPYALARRFPLRGEQIVRATAVHLAGALAMSLCWTFIGLFLSLTVGRRPWQAPFFRLYLTTLLTNLSLCILLYFAVLGCIYAFFYYREVREREAQQARLAAQLAEARLSALRMQLNPHFLFNSLNAITVLVRDQNIPDASRMLELLSGVLRQVLRSHNQQEVTLDEELHFIERYLAIEQVRFSDRLQVQWSVEPAIRDAIVPEFILQPLVENAIRHGAGKRSESGLIDIEAVAIKDDLLLSVRDNGPGYIEGSESGVGLANTRARLETLFGDAAQLDVNSVEGGTVATVRLPLRRLS
jgi:two-component system, LytTR family, sensor kinase